MQRRDFLKGAVAGVAALALPLPQKTVIRQYVVNVTGTVTVSQHAFDPALVQEVNRRLARLMRWYNQHTNETPEFYRRLNALGTMPGVERVELVKATEVKRV